VDNYATRGEELTASTIEITERDPHRHRAAIRVIRRFPDSEIVQTSRLWPTPPASTSPPTSTGTSGASS
jgi:hypothetical protein